MKVSKLTGPALDWAVATATDSLNTWIRSENPKRLGTSILDCSVDENTGILMAWSEAKDAFEPYSPSTNQEQGGQLIDRYFIATYTAVGHGWCAMMSKWTERTKTEWSGPTRLVAAMRCLVGARYGEDIDLPKELR